MVGSIVVLGALTCCALVHSMCDLKTTQENVQYELIWNFEFEYGYNATEATKNLCAKGDGKVDHSTVNRELKKFCLGCKNLSDLARSDLS